MWRFYKVSWSRFGNLRWLIFRVLVEKIVRFFVCHKSLVEFKQNFVEICIANSNYCWIICIAFQKTSENLLILLISFVENKQLKISQACQVPYGIWKWITDGWITRNLHLFLIHEKFSGCCISIHLGWQRGARRTKIFPSSTRTI